MGLIATAEEYWGERKDWLYYRTAVDFALEFAPKAQTVIEVGPRDTPFLELIDWVPSKTAIDRYFKPNIRGATNLQGDFMKFEPPRAFDLVFCLQVLEHLHAPDAFAQKLLRTGKTVIISVPYKWREGHCKWHVQDPVTEEKLLGWTNKAWLKSAVLKDEGAERLVTVFEGIH
jgi:SAM-dependent methyltransferase